MAGNKSKEVIGAAENTTSELEALRQSVAEFEAKNSELKNSLMELNEAFGKVVDMQHENERLGTMIGTLLAKVGLDPNSDLEAIKNFYPEAVAIKASAIRQELLVAIVSNMDLSYPRDAAQRAKSSVDEILKTWGICDGQ